LGALGQGAQNGGEKDVFCKEYNEVAFLCNETDRYEIPAKTSIGVLHRTLMDEFRKFSLKVMILPPNRHSWVFVTVLRLTRPQVTGYVSGLC